MDGLEEEGEEHNIEASLPFKDDDLGYMLNDPNFCGEEILGDAFMEESVESPVIEANDASNSQAIAAVDDEFYLRPDTSHHYANDLSFGSKEETKEWLINKAKEKMCVVVQNRGVKDIRFEMICERGGEKKSHKGKNNKYVRKTERKKYQTHTKKIGCPFNIVFYKPDGRDGKECKMSKVANGCHNHDDPDTLVGHIMVAKLKPHEMDMVKSMRIQKASVILSKIQADDPDNLSFLSTIKAALDKIKRKEWDGRTVMQQSEWLAELHDYTLRKE
ncbi:uncharacterized protein LOC113338862 isoform X2 [Papaver somniferum]|uniref:uncharacterized protein LOC113338862 isoform X2 n=1 Tax=Papaver somniferum TaxID=3469 RepID=UPI000E6FAEA8|nr:uncharacterized protein LOC113338862 isoform X2 [Papaver somniferum]XP_026440048.1 uncharacterized protein LOC113338862 isoform X2 [Papaver somniferum]